MDPHSNDAKYNSDNEKDNFEAFFDEEGDDIMAEIILRMYEMETGRGATGSKRRKIRDLVERLRRSEESKRLEAEKLARVAVCVEIIASSSTPSTRRLRDGAAMPVPRRSTEPGAPDALVDFHTEGDTQKAWTLPQQSVSTSQHFGEFVPSFEQTYAPSQK